MKCNTTRLDKTWSQDIIFLKISKLVSEMLTRANMYTLNWNLRWHSWNLCRKSWGSESRMLHLDTIWFLKTGFARALAHLLEDLLIFQVWPLKENASHLASVSCPYLYLVDKLGALILRMRDGAKHSHPGDITHENTRNQPEIIKINDLANEPGHMETS